MEKVAEQEGRGTVRVVFFGTSEFALKPLERLALSHHEILCVITTPDARGKRGRKLIPPPVKVFAQEHSLELHQPESLKSTGFIELIKQKKPDLFVVVSYGKFLPAQLLDLVKYRLNIHPSLLPKYRGPSPINYALLNGDTHTGVSIIDVTSRMDAGDIYMQWVVPIKKKEKYPQLHDRLSGIGAQMLLCVMDSITEIKPAKQDESRATYTRIIQKEDGKVDFCTMKAAQIENMVRAFYPWPGVYFRYSGKLFKLIDVEALNMDAEPCTVALVDKSRLVIGCKEGAISIKTIQPESKKPMDIRAFLAGYRFKAGDIIR